MGPLGAHVSIAGGLEKALERGESLGCESIQIFTKNQRRWKAGPLTEDAIDRFERVFQTTNIRQVIVHDSYLINLAREELKHKRRLEKEYDESIGEN